MFSLRRCGPVAAVVIGGALGLAVAAAVTAAPATAAPRDSWLTAQHLPLAAMMPEPVTSQPAGAQPGGYVALGRAYRALDRTMPAGALDVAPLAGNGGVPASGAAAAVVEITAAKATAPGELTVFTGRRGGTATVQYAPGAASTSTAVVPLVHGGRFKVTSVARQGRVHATVDVVGYYETATATEPGSYHPVQQTRVVPATPVAAGRLLRPRLAGEVGVPRRAGAVAVSVTASRVRADGAVLAGDGASPPTAAIAHTARGRAVSAFAVLPLSGGRISLRNRSTGPMSLAVDVLGYYDAGVPDSRDGLATLSPTPVAARPIAAQGTLRMQVGGRAGVPKARVSAVLATVHAVNPATAGQLRAGTRATAVSFAAHRTAANTVLLPVSHGHVTVRNLSSGRVTVQLDVRGYVPGNPVPAPLGTATARYLNALHGPADTNYIAYDQALLRQYGCDDAKGGVTFALLDIGAQTISGTRLTPQNPGVSLALTPKTVRLSNTDLLQILPQYFAGYHDQSCGYGSQAVRLAVGTNNDGVFSGKDGYAAGPRGTDWASLVTALAKSAPPGDSVVGANDIEAQFAGTEAQAEAWENSYLAHTGHRQLIYNGDANDCPTTYGATGRSCAYGWTEQQYYQLAHHGARIQVLPQLFFPGEAVKWANIDATGGGGLVFAGALTENARVTSELSPAQGRAALYRALSSVVVDPEVPLAVDLQADA